MEFRLLAWLLRAVAIVSVDMGVKNPRACYRELGAELVRVRKAAGLTGDELATMAGWSRTRVWRMESGQVDSPSTDVIHYVVRCGMTEPEMKDIVELARLAERKQGYWLSRHDGTAANSLRSLVYHESTSCRSVSYEPLLVPGLLQTRAYARARISVARGIVPADIEAAVQTRMDRQGILYGRNPTQSTFIINEQALRVPVGGPRVMQEQLLHLVLMSALDQVRLRIVPTAMGERSVFGPPFRLFEYTKCRPLVYLDQVRSGLFVEDRRHVEDYHALLPEINRVALDAEESRSYVANLADRCDRGSLPVAAHVLAAKPLQQRRHQFVPRSEPPTPIYE